VRQSNSFLGEQLKNFKTAICTIDGDFFFVTNETLYLYYRNKKFALNHLNGLLTSEINALSYQPVYKTLCVATVKGLNKINLEKLFFSRFYPPQPQIESVRGGEKIYLQPKGELYFEQNENYISIAIEPWNYTEIKSLHFLYTIDDNQHWEVTTNTKIDFSALSYGKHIIKIKAKTANSDYSKLLEQPVYIEYPFYLQWWFFFSVIIVVIVIVSSFFYSRIQLIRQGNREKQNMFSQIIELKQKGLAASMNPHFIFNSLNSIQYFVNSNNMLEANEYMAKFAKLIRLYLSSSLEGHLTLQEEIHRLELYLSLEKMRFGERLTFAIKHNNIDDLSSIKLPTMLIQPFVENAILHGILPSKTNGYIEIEFLQAEHELIIQIKDNGIGIDKTKTIKQSNHTSYAMEVILERIRIDNKTNNLTTSIVFYAAKEKGFSETGTVVEIRLSLK
jgi:hypothetical protein